MLQAVTFRLSAIVLMLGLMSASSVSEQLSPTSAMTLARAAHSATPLPDGKVLIAGGCIAKGCETKLTASAELYDPRTSTFRATGELELARVGHQAVMLANDKALILGGWAGDSVTSSVERYDPETGRFEPAGEMLEPRDGFTATRLKDGRVLITGGYNGRMTRLNSAELYNPETENFTVLNPMLEARMSHTATLLADGRVLIVGGSHARGQVSATAELFDPTTQQFSALGPLHMPRHKHAAVKLQNGNVLIIGGAGAGDWHEQYSSTELFDMTTLSFRPAAAMTYARFKLPDAVALLPSGDVLVAGGGAEAELYHPETDAFSLAPGNLEVDLAYTTVAPLANGQFLITGGYDKSIRVVNNAWIYSAN